MSRGSAEVPLAVFAIVLIVVGAVLTAPVSYRLARARWTRRAPRSALVLWQAVCLAAGFSIVAGLVLLAVEPLGDTLLGAAWNFFAALFSRTLELPDLAAGLRGGRRGADGRPADRACPHRRC